MFSTSATQGIAAGASSIVVVGAFVAPPYQVTLAPAWMTDYFISGKTATQFTITFSVPAPVGGSEFDWSVSDSTVAATGGQVRMSGGTQAILAGAFAAVVVGAFTTPPYQVSIAPAWMTDYFVSGKSATQFTITFSVPAPAGNSEFDWTSLALATAPPVLLSDYLATLRRYLHDPTDVIWNLADKIAYLNEAMQQRDLDAGARRSLLTFPTVVGQDTYNFTQLGDGNIFDIISLALQYGGFRRVLGQASLTELSTGYRAYLTTYDVPAAWCRYGDSQIVLAPLPSQAYTIEVDCLIYGSPNTLTLLTDRDPVPFPWTYPVPMYAAYLAKINERQYSEGSEVFLDRYQAAVSNINGSRVGTAPTMYKGA